jgi:hypothetical protein
MIAKCGERKIHHWSHIGKLECDPSFPKIKRIMTEFSER